MVGDRRGQIVDAAVAIARVEGLPGLSVRRVATAADVGASTLRHYFPTQRELHEAVIGEMIGQEVDDVRIADRTVPPAERLTECLAQFLPPEDGQEAALQAVVALWAAAWGSGATSSARATLSAMVAEAGRRVARWLDVLAGEQALRTGDRDRQVALLLAVVDGLALRLLDPEAGATVADARAVLRDAVGVVVLDG